MTLLANHETKSPSPKSHCTRLGSWFTIAILFTCAASIRAQETSAPMRAGKQAPLDTISLPTDLVSLTVTVTDKQGRFYPGLTREAFSVFEDGIKQEIIFFRQVDGPATVGIVFDVSDSMEGKKIERARAALTHFFETVHPEDEYTLVAFNDSPQLLIEPTRDASGLLDTVTKLEPKGHTALFDAVTLALDQVRRGRYAKRALIVISDGGNNRSRTTYQQMRRLARESDVLIYTVVVDVDLNDPGDEKLMEDLATESGGAAFFPTKQEDIYEAFEWIALLLRQHYSLGYLPANFRSDGKWHRLKVKVTPLISGKKLVVRCRNGYFANAANVLRKPTG